MIFMANSARAKTISEAIHPRISMSGFPSSRELVDEALEDDPTIDVNALHSKTFDIMTNYRSKYYESKVDLFLSRLTLLDIPTEIKEKLKEEMLRPITVGNKEYSNFMEEASRRISQTFQVISGNIAELCAQRELERVGLQENVNFVVGRRRRLRTDLVIYYPSISHLRRQLPQARHRVEVKNVKLRERATRGLGFDGDSLFGFFSDVREFSRGNVEVIDGFCQQRSGYCYIPPSTLAEMTYVGTRFRTNTQFGKDMLAFSQTGTMP